MPPKFDVNLAASKARAVDVDQCRIQFLRALCKERTNTIYDSYFTMITRFLTSMNEPILTKDIFLRMISETATQKICNAKMLRSALLSYQNMTRCWLQPGERNWASDHDVILFCNGAYKVASANKRMRGSITNNLFEDLMGALLEDDIVETYPLMPEAFKCLSTFGMRWSQFEEFRLGDLHTEGTSDYVILRKDKRVRAAGANADELHYKLISAAQKEYALQLFDLFPDKVQGQVLFEKQDAPVQTMRKFIQATAKKNNWPANVEFDGPHCFRHGFAANLMSETINRAQQSQRTVKTYAVPNAARNRK